MIATLKFPTLLKFPLGGAQRELERVSRMFSGAFRKPFQSAFATREAAAAANWWEAGGATGCDFAYKPKGAASLAASYVNLVTPATNDAEAVDAPTLDANGWVFNGTSDSLRTSSAVTLGNSYTFIARIITPPSSWVDSTPCAIGTRIGTPVIAELVVRHSALSNHPQPQEYYSGWKSAEGSTALSFSTEYIVAMKNDAALTKIYCYISGTTFESVGLASFALTEKIYLGSSNGLSWFNGTIMAIAGYSQTALSAAQLTAVAAAMQAL